MIEVIPIFVNKRPEQYTCEVGDILKIHTYNFGNRDYVKELEKFDKNTLYEVVKANKSSFELKPIATLEVLIHNKFTQRHNGNVRNPQFGYSFEIVYSQSYDGGESVGKNKLYIKGNYEQSNK